MGFWDDIAAVLDKARETRTADELIAVVKSGPDQGGGCADAFFAGSGGDGQLLDVLDENYWRIHDVKATYWWQATSTVDGSGVEYVEGDLYRRWP